MTIAVFRVDGEQQGWMYKEILEGRLRQGWGARELSLRDQDTNQVVPKEKWETTYQEIWEDKPSPRRYSILSRMLQLNDNDIVVIPKMPHTNQFTIARVSEGYKFDFDGSHLPPKGEGDSHRHVIHIDPNSVRTFHYHANDDSFRVSGLFSLGCHRPAVSFNHDSEHRQAIERLLKTKSTEQGQDRGQLYEAIISEIFKEASLTLQDQIKVWNGQKFEKFVQHAFKEQGYDVKEDRPRYDGQGADCDILVSLPSSHYDLFLPKEEIAIQVKCKQGIDDNDVEAIQQIINWTDLYRNTAMMKCVISSADDFTDAAKELAEKNEVLLVCGLQTMCFLLGIANRYRDDWQGVSD